MLFFGSSNDAWGGIIKRSMCAHLVAMIVIKDVYDKPGSAATAAWTWSCLKWGSFTNISPQELCGRVAANRNAILLDVRSVKELMALPA